MKSIKRQRRPRWRDTPSCECLLLIALSFALYFVILHLVAIRWKDPHPLTLIDKGQNKEIDVIGIAVKPTCVTKKAVEALNSNFGPGRIIIVTTTEQACQKFKTFASNVECMVETVCLPSVSKNAIRDFLHNTYNDSIGEELFKGRDLSGWYLQQFLKLGAILYIPNLSDYYVIWDLDMILLQGLSIFHFSKQHGRQTILNIGGHNHPGYDYAYKNLTDETLLRAADGTSFVCHWIAVYKPLMAEFIDYLSTRPRAATAPSESPWVWAVLSALDPNYLNIGFSEYASYSSWVLNHHPNTVHEMSKMTWTRHPFGNRHTLSLIQRFSEDGLCCPTDKVLTAMRALNYTYFGFEIGHNERCDYNNPKYDNGYGV